MKLKNDQEIGFISCEYADQSQKNRTKIAWVLFDVKEAYKKGYTQAQQDLLASVSEGFEEWKAHNLSCHESARIHDLCERSYQAAKLSQAKELEELRYYKEQWQSIAGKANLKNLVATAEKLEKENEELKKQIKLLEMNQHFMEKEIKGVLHE